MVDESKTMFLFSRVYRSPIIDFNDSDMTLRFCTSSSFLLTNHFTFEFSYFLSRSDGLRCKKSFSVNRARLDVHPHRPCVSTASRKCFWAGHGFKELGGETTSSLFNTNRP